MEGMGGRLGIFFWHSEGIGWLVGNAHGQQSQHAKELRFKFLNSDSQDKPSQPNSGKSAFMLIFQNTEVQKRSST